MSGGIAPGTAPTKSASVERCFIGVDGDVMTSGQREGRGERVRDEGEQRQGERRDRDAEGERGERLDAPGGGGAVAGATHASVDVALDEAVERVRGADDRGGPEHREDAREARCRPGARARARPRSLRRRARTGAAWRGGGGPSRGAGGRCGAGGGGGDRHGGPVACGSAAEEEEGSSGGQRRVRGPGARSVGPERPLRLRFFARGSPWSASPPPRGCDRADLRRPSAWRRPLPRRLGAGWTATFTLG